MQTLVRGHVHSGYGVDLRGENEVVLRQSADRVRRELDRGPSPPDEQIWMMSLVFRNNGDVVHKVDRLRKILEPEPLRDRLPIAG